MLAAYLFCLIAGGLLVGASALFGSKEADIGGGGHDVDLDANGQVDASGAHGPGDADMAHTAGWVPFLSFQFWTFALAFFGLTGTVLTLLGLAGPWATLAAALGLGLGSGTAVSTILRRLRTQHVSSAVGPKDFVGRSARVRVPLRAGSPGKIRLTLKEQLVDLLAVTDEREEIAAGEEVLIVDLQDERAVVVRAVRVEEPRGEEVETVAPSTSSPNEREQS